ncbi:MAG: hypothetical protein RLY70_527 [Planctomycetota bacterium]
MRFFMSRFRRVAPAAVLTAAVVSALFASPAATARTAAAQESAQDAARGAVRKTAQDAATPEQLDRWIADLNADQFLTREAAVRKLIAAGEPAVDRLKAEIPKGSLEMVLRGVHVLRELALSEELDAESSAVSALEQLAAPRLTAAAQRAQGALSGLSDIRQTRASEELQRLGARIGSSQLMLGFQIIEDVTEIDIGERFTGTERDLRRLRWLAGVKRVKFTGPRVTDQWLETVSVMPHITSLQLKKTNVTAEGLKVLTGLERLQAISLMYVALDDAVVPKLAARGSLATVKLYGTKISREGEAELKTRLPAAKIDYRQGGFLGVNCQPHTIGCEVSLVQSKSAAEQAELSAGDVIVKYGEHRVESFDSLTVFISENRPGDKVDLLVCRQPMARESSYIQPAGKPWGVVVKPHAIGCEVVSVEANSPGSALEFRPGDVITHYGDRRTLDPKALDEALKAANAGEEVNVQFTRRPQMMIRTVTLGEWE